MIKKLKLIHLFYFLLMVQYSFHNSTFFFLNFCYLPLYYVISYIINIGLPYLSYTSDDIYPKMYVDVWYNITSV